MRHSRIIKFIFFGPMFPFFALVFTQNKFQDFFFFSLHFVDVKRIIITDITYFVISSNGRHFRIFVFLFERDLISSITSREIFEKLYSTIKSNIIFKETSEPQEQLLGIIFHCVKNF